MKHSEATKKKISKAHKGMKKPWVTKTYTGKIVRAETRQKLREAIRNLKQTMEKNPNWKGGISYKIACRLTLERDDHTCQICGLRDPDVMEVDHRLIRALYPELAQDLNNLWTLCANCHRRKTKRDWQDIKAARAVE